MFDVVLRTGFFAPSPDPLRARFAEIGAARVFEVPLALPAPESLMRDLLALPTTHVLFIDDAVSISTASLKKLARHAQIHGGASAYCINTAVGRRVLGLMSNVSSDNVRTSVVGAMHLTPWCVLVPKSLLAQIDYAKAMGSITGLLMAVEIAADTIFALGGEPDELDFESWCLDVLQAEHERLAGALQNLVPEFDLLNPQFRITARGRHVRIDEGEILFGAPRFSVICPVFKARFLEDTVRSVLAQTYENFEFLILVDGPPEDEEVAIRQVLDQFSADSRVNVVYQQNMGTGRARAALAERATGDYLVSIDDDDMFVPHTLEHFARAIDQTESNEPAALRGGMSVFGFADCYLPPKPRLLVDGIPCDYFEANQPYCLNLRTLRANGGLIGDPRLHHCGEEADYFLRLDRRPDLDVLLIDEPLYLRRLSAHNQTLTFAWQEFHAHLEHFSTTYVPSKYRFVSFYFVENLPYIRQITRFVEAHTYRDVVAGTRYFDFTASHKAVEAIIDLELTALCNADCTFCPRENLGRMNKYLPMPVVERLAAQIARDGVRRKIVLCGIGEPTLHPEVENIVRLLAKAGAQVCMTNNGTRMDTDRFTRLVEAGLQEVNFSINATTEETRQLVMKQKNFERVRQNVREALALRDAKYRHVEVHLSFVLCPQNQHEVDDFVREWRGCTAEHLWIHPVNNRANLLTPEYGEFDPEMIARRYAADPRVIVDLWDHGFAPESANVCSVAQATQFIDADGDVLLCALDHERKNILGNVMNRSLVQIQTDKLELYRRGHFDTFCEGCTYCPRTHKSLAALG